MRLSLLPLDNCKSNHGNYMQLTLYNLERQLYKYLIFTDLRAMVLFYQLIKKKKNR